MKRVCFLIFVILILCSVNVFGAVNGDVDGYGNTDIQDTVVSLQVCVEVKPAVNIGADINGDGKIGLEEAIYGLQYSLGNRCIYSISPTEKSFGSDGGTGSLSVTSPDACNWTVSDNPAWITLTSGSSGTGNGTVAYSVASNSDSATRTANSENC